jgi:hypothetical protein
LIIGAEHAVDDEAGRVPHLHRVLADFLRQRFDRGGGFLRGLQAADQLDQGHHGHRVEEMHPDHLLRTLRRGGESRDRDGGRIGGDHRLRRRQFVELAEDLEFQIEILGRRFDDEVAVLDCGQFGRDPDATERSRLVGRAHALLFHQAVEARADRRQRAVELRLRDVRHRNLESCRSKGLTDTVVHGARAHHAYVPEFHLSSRSVLQLTNLPGQAAPPFDLA